MTAVVLAVVAFGAGCAHYQSPVLYPNAKLQEAGKAQAEAEIAACRSLADDYVSSGATTAKEIGKDTAVGGVGGAAVGATAGAVTGTAKRAGPSPIYKGFVDRCLQERGYQVIGWQ
jgi:hypothetical protein